MLTLVGAETTPRARTRARPGLCASVEWRRDAGVLGHPPLRTGGLWAPAPFLLMQSTLVREWQLGLCLFGLPARSPSRPLMVGFRVAALVHGPPLHGTGGH